MDPQRCNLPTSPAVETVPRQLKAGELALSREASPPDFGLEPQFESTSLARTLDGQTKVASQDVPMLGDPFSADAPKGQSLVAPDSPPRLFPASRARLISQPRPRPKKHRVFMEDLPTFMNRVGSLPPPRMLIPELIPEDSISLWHGQPRSGKTMAMLEALLAMATATPAFGLTRLAVPEPVSVGYITEEDSERRIRERLAWLLAGRGLEAPPPSFYLSARRGVDIDDEDWQGSIILTVRQRKILFLAMDPLRGLTANADQGPAELKSVAKFLRKVQRETGCAIGLLHHDTKPQAGKPDDRARAQRASGGGLFSISDAPVHFESIHEGRYIAVPNSFKFSDDPAPFTFTLQIETVGGQTVSWRLVGEEDSSATVGQANPERTALRAKILAHLRDKPQRSTRNIAEAVKANRDNVTDELERLKAAGVVEEDAGPKNGRMWTLAQGAGAT